MRLSVAGCGRQIIGKVIFVELGACIGESRQPHPQGFSLNFLREKPWGRGWRAEGIFFKSRLCCGLKRRSELIGKVTRVGLCRDPGRSDGANVLKSKTY